MMINNKTSGNLPSIASSSSSTIVAPLSKLSYMNIENTKEALPEECLPNLISLRTLTLYKFPLPQGMRYLTALQHLNVWESEVVDLSNDWDEMEWQGLTTLLSLEFFDLPKLVFLPMGLQYTESKLTKGNITRKIKSDNHAVGISSLYKYFVASIPFYIKLPICCCLQIIT
ncbi:hypothetical protein CFP56_031217 [Quercus suber]|uniref:Uncharacterized protein n=1 Tax=Quercus suber TaxID=58331 RepID=A0AAW0JLB8_QUESU